MPEKTPSADAAQGKTPVPPTAAELETLVTEAKQDGYAEAGLILAMCELAGTPAKAADFIRQKKSAKDVSAELLTAKVAEDQKTPVNPTVMPGVDASVETKNAANQGKAKPWAEVLAAISGRKVNLTK